MDPQQEAYNRMYQAREEDKNQREQLQKTESEGRLLTINGCYDYWENVIPYLRVGTKDLVQPLTSLSELPAPLDSYHLVAIGCPGKENSIEVLDCIFEFLRDGGFVLTTDHCMGNILAPPIEEGGWLGPNLVRMPGSTSGLVEIEADNDDHPLLKGLPVKFSWNIAGGSHLIEVVDPDKIEVLLYSPELKEEKSQGAVMFVTQVGKGTLVHFLSHAYAQTADIQGIQAAATILANLFDLAVDSQSTEVTEKPEAKEVSESQPSSKAEDPVTPWPSDQIDFIEEKISGYKERIRQGAHDGQYLIGEGFSVKVKSAAELVAMGLAIRSDGKEMSTEKMSSPTQEVWQEEPAPGLNEPEICEPWSEDNIVLVVEKLKTDDIPLKRSSSGKYMLGKGFTATLKSAEELIALGYAKKAK